MVMTRIAEATWSPVSRGMLRCHALIVHHSSCRSNHRLESRMREIRPSGSEGGGVANPSPYPYPERVPTVFRQPARRCFAPAVGETRRHT